MAAAFKYRPKYVDIRVNPPAEEAEPARAKDDQACDHVGCARTGAHRAPKARGTDGQYWRFCREHAGEYNRRWDFFRDMSQDEIDAHQRAEEVGHRPLWSFRPGKGDRVSAARFWTAAKAGDSFGLFGGAREPKAEKKKKRVGRVQALALDVLALEEDAQPLAIRTRYAELVKRYHPDSNGGDRSAEAQLNKVIRAYQTLKAAGLT